jgi:sarcosine oxidase
MKIAVIGAGVFGAWCAKFLSDAGHEVTLVDAYGPGNGRASSADFTRVIRAGYGRDEMYSRWAAAAWRDWEWLSSAIGQPFITRAGALFLGAPDDPYIRATVDTLTHLGLAAESLSPDQLGRRFPQIAIDGLGYAVWEPHAGVIRARAAVYSLVTRLTSTGLVTYLPASVRRVDEQRSSLDVRLADGTRLDADVYVCACGAWLPQLFPEAIGTRIRPTRQEVLYFGVPAGTRDFSVPQLPVWIDFQAGLYGIPEIDGHGFKVGVDRHGELVNPDTLERIVSPAIVESTRAAVARRFPAMSGAPLVDARVCQYENTSSGDFIIDRHPQWANCWIVGGGSGHGFKHGPSVGRHVAALVSGEADPIPRFALASKTTVFARTVY